MRIHSRFTGKTRSARVCKRIIIIIIYTSKATTNNFLILILEPIEGYERCPLCSTLVNQNKWREHLMGEHPCINNPRSKGGKSCKS